MRDIISFENFIDHLEQEDRITLYPLLSYVDQTVDSISKLFRSNDQFYSGLVMYQRLLGSGSMDPEYMARSRAKRRRRDLSKLLEIESTTTPILDEAISTQKDQDQFEQINSQDIINNATSLMEMDNKNNINTPKNNTNTTTLTKSIKPQKDEKQENYPIIDFNILDSSLIEYRNKMKS